LKTFITYKVFYSKESKKFIKKHKIEGLKFFDAFKEIAENSLNLSKYDVKIYKGFQNQFRLRIGNFRAIFEIENDILTIVVIKIGSRGDIYK